jgi:hypothetical protein
LKSLGFPDPQSSPVHPRPGLSAAAAASSSLALTIEFVAKPEKARTAPALLPAAITGALANVTGFAGCLVMVSDQEARLITVVTFWTGDDSQKSCSENLRWVRALLSSYIDHCLRVQTMVAHLPCVPDSHEQTDPYEQTTSDEDGSLMQKSAVSEETVCVP